MKVTMLATGEEKDFGESYARRLMDQGQALPAEEKPKAKKAEVTEAEKLPEAEAPAEKPAKGKKAK